MDNQYYTEIIKSFALKKVLVMGDLIVDVYLRGISTRLSPEAPVPVVDVVEKKSVLGGAANTVCNLKAMGAVVSFCSVVGNDTEGCEALSSITEMNLQHTLILQMNDRDTLVKTRVIAGDQVVTRFDKGTISDIDETATEKIIFFLRENILSFDAIIISDYDKGVITKDILQCLRELQFKHKLFIAVDSKRLPFFSRLKPNVVKPNYLEAIGLLDIKPSDGKRPDQIIREADTLFERTNAQLIVVTLDSEGSLIFQNNTLIHSSSASHVPTPHVAGAGDTFLSAFVLGYLCSGRSQLSADIATAAATVVVTKHSTGTCSAHELRSLLLKEGKEVSTLQELELLCDGYKSQGKQIVFTNGCFDILHSGHVNYLNCAKQLGDVLIVGINNDQSIRRLKGQNRPINSLADRMKVVSGLSSVDHIISFGSSKDDTPISLIKIVKPDIFVKGGDYSIDTLPEAETVHQYGGKIELITLIPERSTTSIIKRINSRRKKSLSKIKS